MRGVYNWRVIAEIARWQLAWCEQAHEALLAVGYHSNYHHIRLSRLADDIRAYRFIISMADRNITDRKSRLKGIGIIPIHHLTMKSPLEWM